MRTIKFYHGTNNNEVNNIIDDPRATKAVNGIGFYCTTNIEVARAYGSNVIVFEMSIEAMKMVKPVIRPINNVNFAGEMEYVFNQHDATVMCIEAEDSYAIK